MGPRPVTINFSEFYDRLGMERDVPYTEVELNKSYRKAALKNHPDKGGDVEVVRQWKKALCTRLHARTHFCPCNWCLRATFFFIVQSCARGF